MEEMNSASPMEGRGVGEREKERVDGERKKVQKRFMTSVCIEILYAMYVYESDDTCFLKVQKSIVAVLCLLCPP